MDSERRIADANEFDPAVRVAKAFAAVSHDTLVVVAADHECTGVAIIGASLVSNAGLTAIRDARCAYARGAAQPGDRGQ